MFFFFFFFQAEDGIRDTSVTGVQTCALPIWIAYVMDAESDFAQRCNLQMVDLEKLEDPEEASFVRDLIARHLELTRSTRAQTVLANWAQYREKLVKVMPLDYRRVLEQKKDQAAKSFVMVQHG